MNREQEGPDLFAAPRYPNRAGFKETETSKDAADAIEASGKAKTLRLRAYELFATGWEGTADELAAALGASILSVRPRVSELHRLGYLEHAGVRHLNFTGVYAHVWRMKPTVTRRAG